MKIQTKYHGEIEIDQNKIVTFDEGIPSFEEEKHFAILPFQEEAPFFIMQSTTNENLAFVITNPFIFFPTYDIHLDDETVKSLGIEKEEDVLVYTILTLEKPFQNTTANLIAPIVINQTNQKGKQVVLTDDRYHVKTPLLTPKEQEKAGV